MAIFVFEHWPPSTLEDAGTSTRHDAAPRPLSAPLSVFVRLAQSPVGYSVQRDYDRRRISAIEAMVAAYRSGYDVYARAADALFKRSTANSSTDF